MTDGGSGNLARWDNALDGVEDDEAATHRRFAIVTPIVTPKVRQGHDLLSGRHAGSSSELQGTCALESTHESMRVCQRRRACGREEAAAASEVAETTQTALKSRRRR